MKKIVFALIVLCFSLVVQAQRVYFIYLQSESRAPFYVRMSDKIYSSSAAGFLTLSNLRDSTYLLTIGNPAEKESEVRFSVPLEASDKGFLVKTFDGQLGLFDLQSLAVHKPVVNTVAVEPLKTRTDSFTKLLSQAADDASLLTVPVTTKADTKTKEVKKDEPTTEVKADPVVAEKKVEPKIEVAVTDPKPDTVVVENKKDAVVITKNNEPTQSVDTLTIKPTPVQNRETEVTEQENKVVDETPYVRSTIVRKSESSTTEGFGLVYLDVQTTATDTIRLLIPNPIKPVKTEDAVEQKQEVKEIKTEVVVDPVKAEEQKPLKQGNDCAGLASEKDFLKLRKNMASETNDEEMIAEARKYFRNKCFTTEQIRNLSSLFLTNAAKYQFFDAAYRHVSDSDQFATLGSEIKDEYYSKRFKALIGQ